MPISVFLHIAADQQLLHLGNAGRKEALAAAHARSVIHLLASDNPDSPELTTKRTRYGESRLRNCVKYDLGRGYRLISVRIGEQLYIPFLGTHDACDLWLERHRGDLFTPQPDSYRLIQPLPPMARTSPYSAMENSVDLYEQELSRAVSQADLRAIFCGLWQQPPTETTARTTKAGR